MPSTDARERFTPPQRRALIDVARQSIESGLASGRPLAVTASDYPAALRSTLASFVTLHMHDQLRGCIGHLEASQALVSDVAENAFAAAFRDPRFSALSDAEWPDVDIHVSILTSPQALSFRDETDLLAQLRPGEDGLILQDGAHRSTFLPSVWESLPEPRDFLVQLKKKAGLAGDHWSNQIQVQRYRSESFADVDVN